MPSICKPRTLAQLNPHQYRNQSHREQDSVIRRAALPTDGLIERRDRDFGEGLAQLLAAAAGCQRETADDAVIALFDRLEPPAADDDVCVLAVRVN
jgi:Stage II sporulation protein E (SpoIIE)